MYVCNYCGEEHPDGTRSEEHIIPEVLLNTTYVLKDVCTTANNYFARSFEAPVVQNPFIRYLLLSLDSGRRQKRPVHVTSLDTARGKEEHLWSDGDAEILQDLPEWSMTCRVPVSGHDPEGRVVTCMLDLPFSITVHGTGARSLLHPAAARRRERDLRRLQEYVAALQAEPALDPVFAEFVRQSKVVFRSSPKVDIAWKVVEGPGDVVVDDLKPWTVPFDAELLTKFFMKIAWTHSRAQLPREALENDVARWILGHIRSGHVPESLVGECGREPREQLFREGNVTGLPFSWWRQDIDASRKVVAQIQSEDLKTRFQGVLAQRQVAIDLGLRLVRFDVPGKIEDSASILPRHHILSFEDVEVGGRSATFCRIRLFGGAFDVRVQMFTERLKSLPPPVQIDY